jgi:hypothetical protein
MKIAQRDKRDIVALIPLAYDPNDNYVGQNVPGKINGSAHKGQHCISKDM